jgi:hypothetical protein
MSAASSGCRRIGATRTPARKTHEFLFLKSFDGNRTDWQVLSGDWPTFGSGQKAHFHPRLTPDRQWIAMVAGDPATQTNQIFLLDASDLGDTVLPW